MSPPPPLRFTVLRHTGSPEGDHFDILIETSPTADLATWRSPAWPLLAPADWRELRPHRRAYLTLQGDLGLGRGQVVRVDQGPVTIERPSGHWRLTFPHGVIELAPLDPPDEHLWHARPQA